MSKNNKRKYVRYSDALGGLTFKTPKDLFIDALETNNSPCHLLFDIGGHVSTKSGSNIIKECYFNKDFYQSFREKLMKRCYEVAQARWNRGVVKTSFSGKKEAVLNNSIERLSSTMVIALSICLHVPTDWSSFEVQTLLKFPRRNLYVCWFTDNRASMNRIKLEHL